MNVILLEPVRTLGKTGDVVTVKAGYARNFLVPRGLALPATATNMKTLAARIKAKERTQEREKQDAQKLAEKLADVVVYLSARAGEGKIFGAITHSDVVSALSTQKGVDLDKKRLEMPKAIKELGEYEVKYRAHHDVVIPLKLVITAA